MMEWKRHKGGTGWREDAQGLIEIENGVEHASPALRRQLEVDGLAPFTRGRPLTAERFVEDGYWRMCLRYGRALGVPPLVIAAIMFVESGRVEGHLDPVSIRLEPGYTSDEETPHKVSAGVVQTLLSTARHVAERVGWSPLDPLGEPRALVRRDLYIPDNSIYLGAAYMKTLADRIGDADPLLVSCAYNAGRLRTDMTTGLRLYCYHGDDRLLKLVAYHNDLVRVLRARGLDTC